MRFEHRLQVPHVLLLPSDGFQVNTINWILLFLCRWSLSFWDPLGWLHLLFVLPPLCLLSCNGYEVSPCVSEIFIVYLDGKSGVLMLEPSFISPSKNLPIAFICLWANSTFFSCHLSL